MKRVYCIAFVLALAGFCLSACKERKVNTENAAIGAEVCFEDSICDWGTLSSDSLVRDHLFWFANTGNITAVVLSAKPSCQCTDVEYIREPVRPGAKGWVRVIFDGGKSASGYFDKSVVVRFNAPDSHSLRVKGVVP